MLIGEYIHSVDDKNRLSLPSKFRKELGKKVVISPGLDGCLFVFTELSWKDIAAKLSERGMLQSDNRGFNRRMLGLAVEAEVDSIGRILIPEYLRNLAEIKAKVAIIGVENRLEIWDEVRWQKYKESLESQADTLAEKLGQVGVL
jgi:MraZ protein